MSSKLGIRLGVWLLVGALFLFAGYFIRKQPVIEANISKYASLEEGKTISQVLIPKVNADDLLSKNLFHQKRGVITPEEKEAVKSVPASKGNFELTGIFQYQGVRGALIANSIPSPDTKAPKPRRMYKLGDSLGSGYNLVEISDEQVTIVRGGDRVILPLRKKQEK